MHFLLYWVLYQFNGAVCKANNLLGSCVNLLIGCQIINKIESNLKLNKIYKTTKQKVKKWRKVLCRFCTQKQREQQQKTWSPNKWMCCTGWDGQRATEMKITNEYKSGQIERMSARSYTQCKSRLFEADWN